MKTYKQTTVSKLVDRFDNELRTIIMNDLKAIKAAKNQLVTSIQQGLEQDKLSAA